MPPEYADSGTISPTFDVFSLGVITIGIMDGKAGNLHRYEMPRQEFVDRVMKNILHIMNRCLQFHRIVYFHSVQPIFLILFYNFAGN